MSVIIDINGELVLHQSAGLPSGTDGYDVEITNSAASWAVPSTEILARRRAKSAMAELDMQVLSLSKRLNEVVDELSKVEGELFDLKQQERSAQDVLTRTDVVAPADGILTEGLRATT
jgi:multidrug resistance efflux pump